MPQYLRVRTSSRLPRRLLHRIDVGPGSNSVAKQAGTGDVATTTGVAGSAMDDVLKVVTGLLSQVVAVSALLYYFGWTSTRATYGYFGIDPSLLGLTTADYLIRSAPSAVPVLIGLGLATLTGWFALALAWGAGSPPVRAAIRRGLVMVSGTCVVAGTGTSFGWLRTRLALPLRPLLITVGVALLLIVWHRSVTESVWPLPLPMPVALLALTVSATAGVWSWALFADSTGRSAAQRIATALPYREAVALYSTRRLGISGPQVTAEMLTKDPSGYQVRYQGLRLLVTGSNGDLFLVPVGWVKGHDPVYVIHADATVRIDIVSDFG